MSISVFMGPMAPELIIVHELGMLPIDCGPLRTAEDRGIQYPALHGKAAFRQVWPGMPLDDRCPLNRELIEAGLQGHKHGPVATDEGLWGTPPCDGLTEDVPQPGEVLPVEAARPDDRPAIPIDEQETVAPVPVDLDQIADVSEPDLMRGGGQVGTFIRVGEARGALGGGMGLFVERDQLPHGRMAIPIAQGISSPLHAVVPQPRMIIHQLEHLHQGLDRHPGRERRAGPRADGQPQQVCGVEPALPMVDHRRLDGQPFGHAPGPKANLEQCNDAPAGLLLGRILVVGAKPEQQMLGAQRQGKPLGQRVGLQGQGELLGGR